MSDHAKQIAQLEKELVEFQASSRELERELELELEESEAKHKQLQDEVEELTYQVNDWKAKHLDLSKEYAQNQASLQKQINALQQAHKSASSRLREIEMTNDDMERHERITKSSLDELEMKYHKCLEDIAMLESEVASKEDVQIELQRTKDELRDTKEELAVANSKIKQLEREAAENAAEQKDLMTESPITMVRTHRFRITSDPSSATSTITATAPATGSSSMMDPPSPQHVAALPRMASSKSLRKIHGMLDQMKNLESRVATFKSSLPKPVTPTKKQSASTSSNSSRRIVPSASESTLTPSPHRKKSSPSSPSSSRSSSSLSLSSSPSSPSNLPVASSRRNSSISYIDRALSEKRSSTSSSGDALRRPKLGGQLEPIQGSPSRRPSLDFKGRKNNRHSVNYSTSHEAASSTTNINGNHQSKNQNATTDEKLANRPGSAFSALHGRTGIGHGRFV